MKKIVSLITLVTFLTSNLAYGYDNRGVSGQVNKSHLRGVQAKQANSTGEEMVSAMAAGGISAEYLRGVFDGRIITARDDAKYELIANIVKTAVQVGLKRETDGKVSVEAVFIFDTSNNACILRLGTVLFYKEDSFVSLQGKGLGSEIFRILGASLPEGTVIEGYVTNLETRRALYDRCVMKDGGVYTIDGLRVVDVVDEASGEPQVSLSEILAETLIGRLYAKGNFGKFQIIGKDQKIGLECEGVQMLPVILNVPPGFTYSNAFSMRAVKLPAAGWAQDAADARAGGQPEPASVNGTIEIKNSPWVVIQLAAGKGTRLQCTPESPKPLVHVADKPIMIYGLEVVRQLSLPVVTILGFGSDRVLREGFAVDLKYFIPEGEHAESTPIGDLTSPYSLLRKLGFKGHIIYLSSDAVILDKSAIENLCTIHSPNNGRGAAWLTFLTTDKDNPTGKPRIVRNKKGEFERFVSQGLIDDLKRTGGKIVLGDGSHLDGATLDETREVETGIGAINWKAYRVLALFSRFIKGKTQKSQTGGIKKYFPEKLFTRMVNLAWKVLYRTGRFRITQTTDDFGVVNINRPEDIVFAEQRIRENLPDVPSTAGTATAGADGKGSTSQSEPIENSPEWHGVDRWRVLNHDPPKLSRVSESSAYRDWLVRYITDKFGGNLDIISVGAGKGALEEVLKMGGLNRILAIELRRNYVEECRRKGIEALQADGGDFVHLLDKDRRFDLAVFSESLGSIGLRAVKEVSRVLKTGGRILIAEYPYNKREAEMAEKQLPARRLKKDKICSTLDECGYSKVKIVQTEYFADDDGKFTGPMMIFTAVFAPPARAADAAQAQAAGRAATAGEAGATGTNAAATPLSDPITLSSVIFDDDFALEQLMSDDSARERLSQIKTTIDPMLTEIRRMIDAGEIHPEIAFDADTNRFLSSPTDRPLRVGIYTVAGDPPHWGHLAVILHSIMELKLDKVIVISQGIASYKPGISSQDVRYGMIDMMVNSIAPVAEFSRIGYNSDRPHNENISNILHANANQPVDAFFIAGDEYINDIPQSIEPLVGSIPPSHTLTLALTSRVMDRQTLRREIDTVRGSSAVPMVDLLNPIEGLSSSALRQDNRQPGLPHFIRRAIWQQGFYGVPRQPEFKSIVGLIQESARLATEAVEAVLNEVSIYLSSYPGVNRDYLEAALKLVSQRYGIKTPQVVNAQGPARRTLTLLFPNAGTQVEFCVKDNAVSVGETKNIINIFSRFDSGLEVAPADYKCDLVPIGLINKTYCLNFNGANRSFIVQRLSTIFDLEALEHNTKLFGPAQDRTTNFPLTWERLDFLNVKGRDAKFYYDETGACWRVMPFVPGEVYDCLNKIPEEERPDAIYSMGVSVANFEITVNSIDREAWQTALPHYGDRDYCWQYLCDVLSGKRVRLYLSQDASRQVELQPGRMERYQARVDNLWRDLKEREHYVACPAGVEKVIGHGDISVDNAKFKRNLHTGKLEVVCWLDTDTVGLYERFGDLCGPCDFIIRPGGVINPDADSVRIDMERIDSLMNFLAKGYLDRIQGFCNEEEIEQLKQQVYIMTLKGYHAFCGKLLADFLVGDEYFGPAESEDERLRVAENVMEVIKGLEEALAARAAGGGVSPSASLRVNSASGVLSERSPEPFAYAQDKLREGRSESRGTATAGARGQTEPQPVSGTYAIDVDQDMLSAEQLEALEVQYGDRLWNGDRQPNMQHEHDTKIYRITIGGPDNVLAERVLISCNYLLVLDTQTHKGAIIHAESGISNEQASAALQITLSLLEVDLSGDSQQKSYLMAMVLRAAPQTTTPQSTMDESEATEKAFKAACKNIGITSLPTDVNAFWNRNEIRFLPKEGLVLALVERTQRSSRDNPYRVGYSRNLCDIAKASQALHQSFPLSLKLRGTGRSGTGQARAAGGGVSPSASLRVNSASGVLSERSPEPFAYAQDKLREGRSESRGTATAGAAGETNEQDLGERLTSLSFTVKDHYVPPSPQNRHERLQKMFALYYGITRSITSECTRCGIMPEDDIKSFIEDVVMHLISNAIDATFKRIDGGWLNKDRAHIDCRIFSDREKGVFHFVLQDPGVGIDRQSLESWDVQKIAFPLTGRKPQGDGFFIGGHGMGRRVVSYEIYKRHFGICFESRRIDSGGNKFVQTSAEDIKLVECDKKDVGTKVIITGSFAPVAGADGEAGAVGKRQDSRTSQKLFAGKAVVIIDNDAARAINTKADLIRKEFEIDNIHEVIVTGVDINALEYGAIGVTQEFVSKIKAEIENLAIGKDVELIICNISSNEALLYALKNLAGFNINNVSGRDFEEAIEAIAASSGEAGTSL